MFFTNKKAHLGGERVVSGGERLLNEGHERAEGDQVAYRPVQGADVQGIHPFQVIGDFDVEVVGQDGECRHDVLGRAVLVDLVESSAQIVGRVGEAPLLIDPDADLQEVDRFQSQSLEQRGLRDTIVLLDTPGFGHEPRQCALNLVSAWGHVVALLSGQECRGER